jgi:hypothetical protein
VGGVWIGPSSNILRAPHPLSIRSSRLNPMCRSSARCAPFAHADTPHPGPNTRSYEGPGARRYVSSRGQRPAVSHALLSATSLRRRGRRAWTIGCRWSRARRRRPRHWTCSRWTRSACSTIRRRRVLCLRLRPLLIGQRDVGSRQFARSASAETLGTRRRRSAEWVDRRCAVRTRAPRWLRRGGHRDPGAARAAARRDRHRRTRGRRRAARR